MLVVACQGYSERALVADRRRRQAGSATGRCSCSRRGSPNGFVRRVFEAGADDILMLPQTPEQVRFAIQKLVARKTRQADGCSRAQGRLDLRARAEGRHGQDADGVEPRRRARGGGQAASRSSTSTSSSATSGSASGLRPERTIYDLALAGGTLDAEKLDAYLMAHSIGRRACCSPRPAPTRRASITVELLREVYARCGRRTTSSSSTRRRVHARGDRDDRRLHRPRAWSACSTRSRSRTRSSASRRSS